MRPGRSGQNVRCFELNACEPVQARQLDERHDLRLRAADPQRAPACPESSGEDGEVEHDRGIGEYELTQIDRDVAVGANRPGESGSSRRLRAAILVADTMQSGSAVIELDDRRNLYQSSRPPQGKSSDFPTLVDVASLDDVTDALRDVIDPELGLDFVELGLIYDVAIDDGTVRVTYTLTSPGCPIGPQVAEQIEEFVGELEGVEEVQPTMTFSPPWTPERMSEDAKFALGF